MKITKGALHFIMHADKGFPFQWTAFLVWTFPSVLKAETRNPHCILQRGKLAHCLIAHFTFQTWWAIDYLQLNLLCSYGRINTCKRLLRDMEDTRLLNEGDKKGMTPLHLAAQNGHEKVTQFLLKKGSLFLWYDSCSYIALQFSVNRSLQEINSKLQNNGWHPSSSLSRSFFCTWKDWFDLTKFFLLLSNLHMGETLVMSTVLLPCQCKQLLSIV